MDPGVWSPVSDVGVDPTLGAPQSEAAEGAELWWAGGRLGVGQPEGLRASVCAWERVTCLTLRPGSLRARRSPRDLFPWKEVTLCRSPGWAGGVWRPESQPAPGAAVWEPSLQQGPGVSPRSMLSRLLPALGRESGLETGKTGLAHAWITRLCFRFQHGHRATGLLHLEGAESLVRLELDPLSGATCARQTHSQGTQILLLT